MLISGVKKMNKYSITFQSSDGQVWGYGDYVTGFRNAVSFAKKYCVEFFCKTGEILDFYLNKLSF